MSAAWIDLHAHPGRFFLDGLAEDDPAVVLRGLGGDGTDPAELGPAGMAAVSFATVSDMRVLGLSGEGRLAATRGFGDGEAYADHVRQLATARDAARRAGLEPLRSGADIDEAVSTGTPRVFLACEGADFVEDDYGRLGAAYEQGVRSVQLVHYRQNIYGDLQTEPAQHGGLSAAGAEVVREMNRLGMLVDLAHASFETTRDAVRLSAQPIMISHTHLDGTGRDHPRFVSAEHARLVADAGGVIGVWPSGFSSQTFDDFVHEIVRLAEAVGAAHVGIGTDMDGNYKPVMTNYRQFSALRDALGARGFSSDEVDGVLGGNAARLIRGVCG